MKRFRLGVLSLFVLSLVTAASATVFRPRSDRELVAGADAVVVGTVLDATARQTSGGAVVTDYRLVVERALKGDVAGVITITEAGGMVPGRLMAIAESARYTPGERVMAFLRQHADGSWFTESMTLGRFRMATENGRTLLVRDSSELHEPARDAAAFEQFVRSGGTKNLSYFTESKTLVPVTNGAGAYGLVGGPSGGPYYPLRWLQAAPGAANLSGNCNSSCTVIYTVNGTDTTGSIPKGMTAWTSDPNAWISLSSAGSTGNTTEAFDKQNVIYLNSSQSLSGTPDFCDAALACTVGWGDGTTNVFGGDTFYNIYDADIVIRPGVPSNQMDVLLTHELGHSIGIRHSDQGTPSTTNAVMASTVPASLGANLQQWDRDAVDSLYGNGPACVPPSISSTSPSGNTTVTPGSTVTISVSIYAGTTPLTYQWYQGATGDTSKPVGTNASTFTTPPINSTTNYWVQVTGNCGSPAQSNTVTLTPQPVQGCTKPTITSDILNTTVAPGGTATLTLGVTGTQPISFQWYVGQSGDLSNPINGANGNSFTTPPLMQTTQYWVAAGNSCGAAYSSTATVTVTAGGCTPPSFTLQPGSTTIDAGQQTFLIAAATGATSYQWYRGAVGDTSTPMASNGPSNTRWVNQIYIDFLGRAADPSALSTFVPQLDTNTATRTTIAQLVLTSNEYRSDLIESAYSQYLRRAAMPGDVAYWLPGLTAGMTDEQFDAQILAAPEYFALAGGTNTAWLGQVYSDVLHRPIDPPALAAFTTALATNSRAAVALTILNSVEARTVRVSQWMSHFLRRTPDAPSVNTFVSQLGGGGTDEQVESEIVASDEYFGFGSVMATGPVATTTTFWLQAINACQPVPSNAAVVSVRSCDAPIINSQPQNATIGVGNAPQLAVLASGAGTLGYQWYQGQTGDISHPISGATSATLLTSPLDTPGTYGFWVRISDACKNTDSNTASVTVTCGNPPPIALMGPATAPSGQGYTFNVVTRTTIYSSFQLQESTASDFSANVVTLTSSSPSFSIPPHNVLKDTVFYYRVRGTLVCNGQMQSASPTSTTLVIAPEPPNAPFFNLPTLPCGGCAITQPMFISQPHVTGKQALDVTGSYSVTSDKPWITITPASGPLPAAGTTVTLTIDTSQLGTGSSDATLTVNTAVSAAGVGALASSSGTVPVSVSIVAPVTPKPKDSNPPTNTLLIPAVAHADGIGGSQFQSDIRVTNNAPQQIQYAFTFTPSGVDGTTAGTTTSITVDPGATLALNDIVKNFFGSGVSGQPGAGTLEIRPLNYSGKGRAPSVTFATVASSRTYNTTASGTFGQYIPALPLANFLAKSDTSKISLQQVAESAAYRTNVGFVEGAGQPADMQVTLFDDANNVVATREFSLLPYEQLQQRMSAFFGGATVSDGRVEVKVLSDGGKVSAYASVLDNITSDPLLVFPADPSQVGATRYVVPGVAELNNGAANFHTDMRIFNGGATAANVTLTYIDQNGSSPAPVTVSVAPGTVKAIDNVLPTIFNVTAGGGSVIATTQNPTQLVLTARTFSRRDDGGTFGQFIPGVSPSDAVGNGDRALNVVQLEDSPAFRSNLGIFEVGGGTATIDISGFTPESKVAAHATKTLGPGQFIQLGSIFKQLGFGDVYNGRVQVKVIAGSGRVSAYGSVVDNRTQDPTYVPAQ